MKKILLILMAMFAFGIQNVSAQDAPIKIVTGHPDFKIQIKRCAASGNTVIIDMIFKNEGTTDSGNMKIYVDSFGFPYDQWNLTAYDDEGNLYKKGARVKFANNQYRAMIDGGMELVSGVPMKVSIKIPNVEETATSFPKITFLVKNDFWGIGEKPVEIRNLPITRE